MIPPPHCYTLHRCPPTQRCTPTTLVVYVRLPAWTPPFAHPRTATLHLACVSRRTFAPSWNPDKCENSLLDSSSPPSLSVSVSPPPSFIPCLSGQNRWRHSDKLHKCYKGHGECHWEIHWTTKHLKLLKWTLCLGEDICWHKTLTHI